MIKALILDIGGVLFLPLSRGDEKSLLDSFNETMILLDGYIETTPETKDLLREIYRKSTRGAITKGETLQEMSVLLKIEPSEVENAFKKVYSENIVENTELYEKAMELKKKGYKLGILSTQFHLSKEILVTRKYYDNFDIIELSCDNKLKKPEKESFISILNELGIEPEESIFIDDKQENIEAATKLGMKSILFKNNNQLFQSLEDFDVK